ncbi:MAG: hypothetical protein MUF66_02575 [Gammaproteobacteria bacterium]|jgi:hypothetical protein|nr:hypothetical protein [Gammaproteobacteria bacterium]
MTGNEVQDRSNAPFVLEGAGDGALKSDFESEESRPAYLATRPRVPEPCSIRRYRGIRDEETILRD